MTDDHKNIVKQEFNKQAKNIESDHIGKSSFYSHIDWIQDEFKHILQSHFQSMNETFCNNDPVLEVAAGTCILSRTLSKYVQQIIALDMTPGMLEKGKEKAQEEGITNITFELGDAENTKFKDNTFDVVFCRWTLHHVKNVHKFVTEMARVCKPGGLVIIIDLESPENQKIAEHMNYLERLRDHSHAYCVTPSSFLKFVVEDLKMKIVKRCFHDDEREVNSWFGIAETSKEDQNVIIQHLEKEIILKEQLNVQQLDENQYEDVITGMNPFKSDGKIKFVHRSMMTTLMK